MYELDLFTGITMVLVGLVFLGLSIAIYMMDPIMLTKLLIIGSLVMFITSCYVLIKIVKAWTRLLLFFAYFSIILIEKEDYIYDYINTYFINVIYYWNYCTFFDRCVSFIVLVDNTNNSRCITSVLVNQNYIL